MRLSLLLAALPFLFCTTAAQAQDAYAVILTERGNTYWLALTEGAKETAEAKGVKVTDYYTEKATDAEQQLNICQTVIQTKPKAIIMAAVNPSIAAQCFKQATAQGIVVADVDGSYTVSAAQKDGVNLAFSVGSDNRIIGEEAAKYVANTVGKPDPKIFILEGVIGSTQGRNRAEGFRTKIKELLPKADIVASMVADFDRLKATNATTDVLQREPNLDVIYAANDSMALGAAEAARALHRTAHLKIIGVDGTGDARKAVKEGHITATVAQLPYLMGKRSVELAIDAAQGKVSGKTEITATPVLTKEMLEANTDPLLKYVR